MVGAFTSGRNPQGIYGNRWFRPDTKIKLCVLNALASLLLLNGREVDGQARALSERA
jgi:hypothetical protein